MGSLAPEGSSACRLGQQGNASVRHPSTQPAVQTLDAVSHHEVASTVRSAPPSSRAAPRKPSGPRRSPKKIRARMVAVNGSIRVRMLATAAGVAHACQEKDVAKCAGHHAEIEALYVSTNCPVALALASFATMTAMDELEGATCIRSRRVCLWKTTLPLSR